MSSISIIVREVRKEVMVTEVKRFWVSEKAYVTEYFGLSTDVKPTGKLNGSKFTEIDTGLEYRYDQDGNRWVMQEAAGLGTVIQVEEDTQVNGYMVPKLTVHDVTKAYNDFVKGKLVVITSEDGNQHFAVNQADTISGDICIEILYYSTMLLTYTVLDDDTVEITYTVVG